jgi:ribosomal protein L1
MILVQRSASVAPGMFSAAMAFATEASAQVKATAGVDVKIAIPVGGNASRIAWIANYENLAQYEAAGLKLLGDQKYQELIKKAAGIFVPDTLRDEIWRTL